MKTKTLSRVAIRFAGDSGDGMQLTGARFTQETARLGNDLATKPDFPAEIRAPAGTIGGVSAFQIHFGDQEIFTAGDEVDVLVAMNPAALKANLKDLKQNGLLICNRDAFHEKNLAKVQYTTNPLDDESLKTKYRLVDVDISTQTARALEGLSLSTSGKEKCKNFFALGLACHVFTRNVDDTISWIERKFAGKEELIKANVEALRAGIAFAEASEILAEQFEVQSADLPSGTYRNLTGNQGIALGLIAASELSGRPLMYGSYPITPASDILHELSKYKNFGVRTFQAEDEIAACCSAIGAAYGGALGVTGSSGPGIALKQEAIGLAVSTELPLVIVDVQRAGPSTGMPTKTEQSDLLQVLFGRNGECPVAVLAVSQPDDAFETTLEACRIALEHMTPVFLLSDGHIGTGSQPWAVPNPESLAKISPPLVSETQAENFKPYARNEQFVRGWALPGTKGLEHRIGGIEKQDITGNISYDPENHERMVKLRAQKIAKIAETFPATRIVGDQEGDVLLLGWGSTRGAIEGAVKELRAEGHRVGYVHLRYLNPLPNDLPEILSRFKRVIVPELNSGQLRFVLRATYLKEIEGFSKVQGQPLKIREVKERVISTGAVA
ncbi:MAG: 2-oxoacid:acceptor oxidoreductase subunit alpha [Bdellovibrionales bacterium]|nr:2-oxoacid:acceptor oxidoreductase subunit alpha [Bdellovibrionales bacterium]